MSLKCWLPDNAVYDRSLARCVVKRDEQTGRLYIEVSDIIRGRLPTLPRYTSYGEVIDYDFERITLEEEVVLSVAENPKTTLIKRVNSEGILILEGYIQPKPGTKDQYRVKLQGPTRRHVVDAFLSIIGDKELPGKEPTTFHSDE